MPKDQLNMRTAICLLALLDLPVQKKWNDAKNPMLGIRAILDFAREKFSTNYAENTRESVRKFSVKQLVLAGILKHNPDDPVRAVNSSKNCYQIEDQTLTLLRQYGSMAWKASLKTYLASRETLVAKYACARDLKRIPVKVKGRQKIKISPGKHSDLIRSIIDDFGSIFVPGGELVYVGETGTKWGYFDNKLLTSLGVNVEQHGKMPDIIFYFREKNWLILVEAVVSGGPIDGGRREELIELFKDVNSRLVFVTAFPDRGEVFRKFLEMVAWETEVWCASDPSHLIHFNGEHFLES